jgi:hypothetical protein
MAPVLMYVGFLCSAIQTNSILQDLWKVSLQLLSLGIKTVLIPPQWTANNCHDDTHLRKKCYLKILKGGEHCGVVDIDERIILKTNLNEIVCDGVKWIYLAQDRVQWQAVVKTTMNLGIPSPPGI